MTKLKEPLLNNFMKTHDLILRNAQEGRGEQAIDLELIKTLPVGSLVKIRAVVAGSQTETFWVRISDNQDEIWAGTVVESLTFLKVAYGDRVRFSPVNVYNYEYPEHPNPS